MPTIQLPKQPFMYLKLKLEHLQKPHVAITNIFYQLSEGSHLYKHMHEK